jgi:spore coat polysaccharide biosynthesis protein SpsF (cytidylyltransferase family)
LQRSTRPFSALIRTRALLDVNADQLTQHDREHVTPWFYRNRDQYRIINAEAVNVGIQGNEYTVDTPADLRRLEKLMAELDTVTNDSTMS